MLALGDCMAVKSVSHPLTNSESTYLLVRQFVVGRQEHRCFEYDTRAHARIIRALTLLNRHEQDICNVFHFDPHSERC